MTTDTDTLDDVEAADQPWSVAAPRKPRRKSAYDMPDAEKKAFGERMRTARELAGITLTDAALAMGYAQPVQLSYMENGQRPITVRVLISCANLYGTTTDYLCGLTEDPDRDPAAASVRRISSSISSSIHRLADTMVHSSIVALRKVMPTAAQGERIAAMAVEAHSALSDFRKLNRKFDNDMPGGSRLVARLDTLAAASRDYLEHMQRARRVMQARVKAPDGSQPQTSLLPILDGED